MIGFIDLALLYFIGKVFYALADYHQKSKWGLAVLGILSFYFGILLGGLIIGIVYELFLTESFDELNDVVVGLMALPVGMLTCFAFYKILEHRWSRAKTISVPDEILDANFVNPNSEKL